MKSRKAHVVEVEAGGLMWIKSSSSGSGTDNGCVEIAVAADGMSIRCSRDRSGARLQVSAGTWFELISHVRGPRGD